MRRYAPAIAALIVGATLAFPVQAQDAARSDEEIKALVLEAIRENPSIIAEAFELLQQEEVAAQAEAARTLLNDRREALERDPDVPVGGNPDGDVTIVEFFDYNCPYCKRATESLRALIEADPNVRVVFREWPILGEGSYFAARAALAAERQGRYEDMHWALMGLDRAEEGTVLAAAEALGLDMEALRRDMEDPALNEQFQRTNEMAQGLGFSGTPSFVIGDELIPGVATTEQMQAAIAAAREG